MEKRSESDNQARSHALSRLWINPPISQIDVTCNCGAKFKAWNLGVYTRRRCDKCLAKELAIDIEVREKAQENAFREMVRMAKIPPRWQDASFDESDPVINRKQFKRALEYAQNFNPLTSTSLIIWSEGIGVGKTHLAVCIGNYVLHQLKRSVLFKKARDLLLEMRQTFSESGTTTELDILQSALSVDLLILDDVGLDPPSDWVKTTYWTVFDKRLEWGRPVVVTVAGYGFEPSSENSLADRIGDGALSRLRQLCGGKLIDVSGKDLR